MTDRYKCDIIKMILKIHNATWLCKIYSFVMGFVDDEEGAV